MLGTWLVFSCPSASGKSDTYYPHRALPRFTHAIWVESFMIQLGDFIIFIIWEAHAKGLRVRLGQERAWEGSI